MPNPIINKINIPEVGVAIIGTTVSTAVTEKLEYSPKAVAIFYGEVAKSCYIATGSKRVACVVAAGACTFALIPGAQQAPFMVACAAILRGVNRLK